jgi:hypothetical protein
VTKLAKKLTLSRRAVEKLLRQSLALLSPRHQRQSLVQVGSSDESL